MNTLLSEATPEWVRVVGSGYWHRMAPHRDQTWCGTFQAPNVIAVIHGKPTGDICQSCVLADKGERIKWRLKRQS